MNILTVDEFANQCDPYLEKCGSFKEISKTIFLGNVDKETQAAYGGVVMIGSYEEGTIQFTISFNEDINTLVILFIKKSYRLFCRLFHGILLKLFWQRLCAAGSKYQQHHAKHCNHNNSFLSHFPKNFSFLLCFLYSFKIFSTLKTA